MRCGQLAVPRQVEPAPSHAPVPFSIFKFFFFNHFGATAVTRSTALLLAFGAAEE
jgi:hypothetical protein